MGRMIEEYKDGVGIHKDVSIEDEKQQNNWLFTYTFN